MTLVGEDEQQSSMETCVHSRVYAPGRLVTRKVRIVTILAEIEGRSVGEPHLHILCRHRRSLRHAIDLVADCQAHVMKSCITRRAVRTKDVKQARN